jgi:hypothetical protein
LELVPRFIFVKKEGSSSQPLVTCHMGWKLQEAMEGTPSGRLSAQTQPKSCGISEISENYYPTQTSGCFVFPKQRYTRNNILNRGLRAAP